jgi:hypothetical protein
MSYSNWNQNRRPTRLRRLLPRNLHLMSYHLDENYWKTVTANSNDAPEVAVVEELQDEHVLILLALAHAHHEC